MAKTDEAYVYDEAYLWLAGAGVAAIVVSLACSRYSPTSSGRATPDSAST